MGLSKLSNMSTDRFHFKTPALKRVKEDYYHASGKQIERKIAIILLPINLNICFW